MTSKQTGKKPKEANISKPGIADLRKPEMMSKVSSMPEVQAGCTLHHFRGDGDNVNATIKELQSLVEEVQGGNMKRPEAFLVSQAHVLDEIFNMMARRSYSNMEAGYGDAAERYLRMALKAQSQCRTTIEALAEIKNPRPVAFVKQANISNGPQQVNNGIAAPAHAGEIINQANELSGEAHELLPDTRASQDESRINQNVETVGKIYRAAN